MTHSLKAKKDVAITVLKTEMLARGMDHIALAELIKFPARRVANVLCASDTSWPIRAAINRAFKQTIFTKPNRAQKTSHR